MAGIQRIQSFVWSSLDWLFPPVCAGCNQPGYRWCPQCQQAVCHMPPQICQICGIPLTHGNICKTCTELKPPYEALRSCLIFEGPIRRALLSLKYKRNIGLGESLADILVEYAKKTAWPVELVTAVPSGRRRLAERGYNQAALLARPVAAQLGKPYSSHLIRRARETISQVGLSPNQRRHNVQGAFSGEVDLVSGRIILLVDDVATTGATLSACAEALIEAGAKGVYALTLTRALPHHGFEIV